MTKSQLKSILIPLIEDVRAKLREAYCIDSDVNCNKIGKARVIKYSNISSSNPKQYYHDVYVPKIESAINTPVTIYSESAMTTKYGVHPMGFFVQRKIIGVYDDIFYLYKAKYNPKSMKNFRPYLKYILYHEFGHAIDVALNDISQTEKYKSSIKKAARGGVISNMNRSDAEYFSPDEDYGVSELWAEISAIQDHFNTAFVLKDIKNLCFVKKNYKNGNRISWKEGRQKEILKQADQARKKGNSQEESRLKELAKEYEITKGDFLLQSPAVQRFLNCSDMPGTLQRWKTIELQFKKA